MKERSKASRRSARLRGGERSWLNRGRSLSLLRKPFAAERIAPNIADGSPEDGELVERAARGDTRAFGLLVQRHERAVAAVIYGTTSVPTWTADLAQETFLAAWRSLRSLKESEHFRSWVCGIARNLARHALRRQRIETAADANVLGDALVSGSPDPAAMTLRREEEQMLRDALLRIPETYRLPLVLFYADDERVESIAATLQISVEGVRQRLSRGRRMLKMEVNQFAAAVRKATRTRSGFAAAVVLALGLARSGGAEAAARPRGPFSGFQLATGGAIAVLTVLTVALVARRPAPLQPARAPARVASLIRVPAPVPAAPAPALDGTVLGPDGNPFDGAEIVATAERSGPMTGTRSEARGRFRLSGLLPGRYTVTATGASHLPARAVVSLTGTGGRVELRLGRAGVTLSGRVTDAVAGPVPGAFVRAYARSFDETEPRAVYQAVSDAQGRYQIAVAPGRYALAASGTGYATQSSRVHAAVDQVIDFALPPGARLGGRVVASGAAVPGATVRLLPEGEGDARVAMTGPDGQFVFEDVAPGGYRLWGGTGALAGQAAVPLRLALGDRQEDATLALEAAGLVSGRVVREGDGTPVSGAEVSVADGDHAVASTQTDRDGRYRLGGVLPGQYFLDVRSPGRASARRPVAVKEPGETPQQPVALGPAANVRGRVVARGGAAVADAQVTARVRGIGRAPGRTLVARTDEGGRFVLPDIDPGEITLAVDAGARGRADLRKSPLAAGETRQVELTLGPGVSVSGTVRFEEGTPAAGAIVTAAPPDGEMVQTRTDDHGRFALGSLPPGELLVAAWPQGGDTPLGVVDLRARRASIYRLRKPGRRAVVELQLPRAFPTVAGVVTDGTGAPVSGATVELASAVDWPGQRGVAWTLSGADGRFTFERVPLSSPAVVVSHPAYAAGPPVAIAGAETRIRLAAPATMSGLVTDPAGRPIPRYRISAIADDGLGDHRAFPAGATGQFRLEGLPPGRYDLMVTTPDDAAGILRNVEVAAGSTRTDLRVVVAPGASLTGRVIAAAIKRPPAGALVITRQGDLRRVHAVDPAGFFRAEGLVPGQGVSVDIEPGFSAYRHSTRVFQLPEAGGSLDVGLLVRYRLPRSLIRDARGLLVDIGP
jgi:RNA polymerase sigma factor (sigma-70 family)